MDNQDLVRSHSSGHESHGVLVCNKCGWPFPNPHPSARHRRAHKRICGTIDGYKLAGSEDNSHLLDSDDDHSDEERKTPSPNVLERSNNEKGSSGGTGEGSVRSEDGVFSDAVAEFSDSGSGAGTSEGLEDVRESATNVESIAKSDSDAIQSLNDGEITENTTNQLGYASGFQGSLSTSNISSMTSSESAAQDDRNGSEAGVHPIKYEMLTDVSEDSEKTHTTDSVVESSFTSLSKEDKMKGIEASNLDRNFPYPVISPNNIAGETAEGVSKLEGTIEVTSVSVRDNEVVPPEKEHKHASDLYIPHIDLRPEVESVEHVNASVDTAENEVVTTDGIHFFNSGGLTESRNWNGEGNANVHVLSVPDDTHVVDNPEAMLEGFKNHKEEELDQPTFLDSWEQFNDKGIDIRHPVSEENFHLESSHLSGGTMASSDMLDLEASHDLDGGTSKPMVEELPAGEEANVSQIQIKSAENQSSDEIAAPADTVILQIAKSDMVCSPKVQESNYDKWLQMNFPGSGRNALSGAKSPTVFCNAGINQTTLLVGLDDIAKDEKCDLSGDVSSKGPAEEKLLPNPIDTLQSTRNPTEFQINPASKLRGNEDAGDYEKVMMEKRNIIGDAGYHEAEKCDLAGDDGGKGATEKTFSKVPVSNLESASCLSELQVSPVSDSLRVGEAVDSEKDQAERCGIIGDDGDHGKTEKYALTGDDYIKISTGKIVAENPMSTLESASRFSELQNYPATNIHDGNDSGDHDEGEIEKSLITANESREGPVEENLRAKPKYDLPSSSNSSRADLDISDRQKSVTESEIGCNDKVQLEVGVKTAAGSDHGPNVESSQKSLEDCGMKELGHSSLDAESPVISSVAAEDNSSRELRGFSSGLTSHSLLEENDKNFIKPQLISSALDAVDSHSQTDSLEGNWGSVSVLSIQSDAQAVLDAECVPPTDSQASLEEMKSKAASVDKSDVFEAPSFMTLVESGGVSDQKATAAEVQTSQNQEQPKSAAPLQAGWFPSISHVVNESQGRRKNEEIIAKVTNWSTGKQHTPLKNLSGEAYLDNKAKSLNQIESLAPALEKDDKAVKVKESGAVATTVNSIMGPEAPTGQADRKEDAKEWNSSARYPSEIKSEKKKAKGRAYWGPFVCCSSVH